MDGLKMPVMLFTGFLESGKTKFIQETLEDKRFNDKEKTLLIVCEEGIEEYEPEKFSGKNVVIEVIEEEDDVIKIAIVGRPNAGKSSIVNSLLNENRVIVSDVSGTTRDSIDSRITYKDKEVQFSKV